MRITNVHTFLFLILVLLFSSCVTTRKTSYLQKPINFIPAYKDSVGYREYKLKTGDKLFIQLYSLDEKTNTLFNGNTASMGMQSASAGGDGENMELYSYVIDDKGDIQLPLVGKVHIADMSIREAKSTIEETLKPLVQHNSVDLRIIGKYFNVIGSGISGRFAIPREKINIFQALALAGDLSFYTDRTKIRILRETKNGPIVKSFDVRSIDIVHSEFYYIEPNDVIFLQPMKEQFLGVTTLWGAISTIMTTYAFGVIIQKTFFK